MENNTNILCYDEFLEEMKSSLSTSFGEGADVEIRRITKNNGVEYDTLTVNLPESRLAPALYLNDVYEDYYSGRRDMKDIVRYVVDAYEKRRAGCALDPGMIEDYQRARGCIGYKLINYKKNKKLLKEIPCRRVLDMAMVYVLLIRDYSVGNASVLIRNEILNLWGIDARELKRVATHNMPRLSPAKTRVLTEYIKTLSPDLEDCPDAGVMILTNESGYFGAGVICYKDVLRDTADMMEDDLYILPSSIHEVLALGAKDAPGREELYDMVRSVNKAVVSPTEILSDNVYFYDRSLGELRIL